MLNDSTHTVVPHGDWIAARTTLLAKEKEFTRLRDELSQARRDLPWEEVTKEYVLTGPDGPETLGDLFAGRSQLIVYHFMYPEDWDDGCRHCSFWADNFDPIIVHLNANDVSMVAVSIAPIGKLEAYRRRMGWSFHWASAQGSDFSRDFGVSFTPEELAGEVMFNYRPQQVGISEREGMSVFCKDAAGRIFHTYSAYARGIDMFNTAYHYLDTVPLGRQEDAGRGNQWWVKRHDEY
jgi:predicted dithiol-disulfide oxidoreductase (DUF899 family)